MTNTPQGANIEAITPALGNIIFNRWGSGQTNVDFYQIIKVTAKTIKLRAVESTEVSDGAQSMSGKVTPVIDGFSTEKTFSKRIGEYDGKVYISFEYGVGKLWDGKPMSVSHWA